MTYPQPTEDVPDWDALDDNTSDPTSGLKATGWLAFVPPPHQFHNWFWRGMSRWGRHFRDAVARYLTLYAAGDDSDLTTGSTFMLWEDDATYAPGSQIASLGATAAPGGVAVTDRHVLTSTAGNLRAIDINTGTVTDIALPGSGTVGSVRTDGSLTCVARGTDLHVYNTSSLNPASWSLVATLAHGALVYDSCMDGNSIYLVGATSGAIQLRQFSRLGVAGWTYTHGGALFSCCTDGTYVFVAGAAGTGSTTIRAIDATDGTDAANDGGNGVNATIGCWDATTGTFTAAYQLACDRHRLYAADTTGNLQIRCKGEATVISTRAFTGIDTVACDQDYVFAGATGTQKGFDHNGICSWTRADIAGVTAIATSGSRLYYARNGSNDILRIGRGNRPGFWAKGAGIYTTPRFDITPF